jgi:hypothetical protein
LEISGQLHVSAALPSRKEPAVPVGLGPRADQGDVEKRKLLTIKGLELLLHFVQLVTNHYPG